eukprot:4391094-Prymnesium_polylepis.1
MEPVMRPKDPPVVGMLRAGGVRQCFGGAAAHLLSAIISVGGSLVEDLGRHSWLEAARGLLACWTDISSTSLRRTRRDCCLTIVGQLGHFRSREEGSTHGPCVLLDQCRRLSESHLLTDLNSVGGPSKR